MNEALAPIARIAAEAVLAPVKWREYLAGFKRYFRADLTYLTLSDNRLTKFDVRYHDGFTESDFHEWASHWHSKDPWLSAVNGSELPLLKVVRSNELCGDHRLVECEAYREFFQPRRLHYGGCVSLLPAGEATALQMMLRPKELGPLSAQELRDWNELAQLIQPAVVATIEHNRVRRENHLLRSHFESQRTGILFVSPEGRILQSNVAAQEILSRRGDVAEKFGELQLYDPALQKELKRILGKLAGGIDDASPWLKLSLPEDVYNSNPPLVVVVIPVGPREENQLGLQEHAMMVYLVEPGPAEPLETRVLEQLFGWTTAESRVAGLLATGASLEEVSQALGMGVGTARNHLKSVYAKTGFSRQGELIAFLNRLALRDPLP